MENVAVEEVIDIITQKANPRKSKHLPGHQQAPTTRPTSAWVCATRATSSTSKCVAASRPALPTPQPSPSSSPNSRLSQPHGYQNENVAKPPPNPAAPTAKPKSLTSNCSPCLQRDSPRRKLRRCWVALRCSCYRRRRTRGVAQRGSSRESGRESGEHGDPRFPMEGRNLRSQAEMGGERDQVG